MAWSVQENSVRASPTSIVWTKPNAAGITWNNSSTATPTVVHSHMTALATVANIASGTGRPGFSRFQACIATSISTDQNQADVEPRAGGQRRIEREEHRSLAGQDRHHRHHHTGDRQPERAPGPGFAG